MASTAKGSNQYWSSPRWIIFQSFRLIKYSIFYFRFSSWRALFLKDSAQRSSGKEEGLSYSASKNWTSSSFLLTIIFLVMNFTLQNYLILNLKSIFSPSLFCQKLNLDIMGKYHLCSTFYVNLTLLKLAQRKQSFGNRIKPLNGAC